MEFGEKVVFKVANGAKMEKLNPRWDFGIFVGVKRSSGELMIARPEGVFTVRSARRLPTEMRWGEDCVNWVCWAPWRLYKECGD